MKRIGLWILAATLLCLGCHDESKDDTSYPFEILTAYAPGKQVFYDEFLAQGQKNPGTTFAELGFYIDTLPLATHNSGTKVIAGSVADSVFSTWIADLEANKVYYLRAYGTDTKGNTRFGRPISIHTPTTRIEYAEVTLPPTTSSIISARETVVYGQVASTGNDPDGIVEYGAYYWLASTDPEQDPKAVKKVSVTTQSKEEVTTTTPFEVHLAELTPNTEYKCQVYARNNRREKPSEVFTFKTKAIQLPKVSTNNPPRLVATTLVVATGLLIDDGDDSQVEYGIYFGTSPTALTERVVATDLGSSADAPTQFSVLKNGLSKLTTYYVRAFAKNAAGEAKGVVVPLTTLDVSAPILRQAFYNYAEVAGEITTTTVNVYADILSDGGETLTQMGAYWGTQPDALTNLAQGSITGTYGDQLKVTIGGLSAGQRIYYYLFATNSKGTTKTAYIESITSQLSERKWVDAGGKQDDVLPNNFVRLSTDVFDTYYEMPPITVTDFDGKVYRYYFLDRNVGASKVAANATTVSDMEAIGNMYYWRYPRPVSVPSMGPTAVNAAKGLVRTMTADDIEKDLPFDGAASPAPAGYTIPSLDEWEAFVRTLPANKRNAQGLWETLRMGLTGMRNGAGSAITTAASGTPSNTILSVFAREPLVGNNQRPGLQADANGIKTGINTDLYYNIIANGANPVRCFRKMEVTPTP